MRFLSLLCLTFALGGNAYAQTDAQRAKLLGDSAVKMTDAGKIDASIAMLRQAERLDPSSHQYPYEIAYAQYQKKDYKGAVATMKRVMASPGVNDLSYQMLGNIYDDMGDSKAALRTYADGLKRFPASGRLFLETGNVYLVKEDFDEALRWYEKGIVADPNFPSNYYRATLLFAGSNEKVWAMMYGEIFVNLERGSKRTAEISKLMYDTYQNALTWDGDTSLSIKFSALNTITTADTFADGKPRLPFGVGVYEPVIGAAAAVTGFNNLEKLCAMRAQALEMHKKMELSKGRPLNVVFAYQQVVADAGHLDAYNHLLLSKGEPKAFDAWVSENEDALRSFLQWFRTNGLEIDERNKLVRQNA